MNLIRRLTLLTALLSTWPVWSQTAAKASVYEAREKDWRNGAIVYQVLVDRFAPPADLAELMRSLEFGPTDQPAALPGEA